MKTLPVVGILVLGGALSGCATNSNLAAIEQGLAQEHAQCASGDRNACELYDQDSLLAVIALGGGVGVAPANNSFWPPTTLTSCSFHSGMDCMSTTWP